MRTAYAPSTDGDADPGEIVWTWVPYEEADGRGKDRPVLVVASERSGTVLAVQLTSQAHPGRPEYVPIGSGPWDSQGRPSYVNLQRVFRVHQGGMRREAAALERARFDVVRAALAGRYGWS
ncbi:type II toxin-antitoxin system PemK/MazF family toxin [Leifsonia poae]|uniref:mRNA interferase PemK n=1 Tax=Leifsonia poae TaxID=110933 RepID=A0A9W6M1Z9_9MICO|nr:type II toxin-antitoxin system PemK/MazF family toxin [Leifsonia poae]GLJ78269.1 mRNA interferase PemK [Leifsonia poae]